LKILVAGGRSRSATGSGDRRRMSLERGSAELGVERWKVGVKSLYAPAHVIAVRLPRAAVNAILALSGGMTFSPR
jgi:hypothetical protein